MKAAVLFPVPVSKARRFAWRWRSADYAQDSKQSFAFYADCAADAERNGYKVELGRIEARSDLSSGLSVKRA